MKPFPGALVSPPIRYRVTIPKLWMVQGSYEVIVQRGYCGAGYGVSLHHCDGLHVCVLPNSYVETLTPSGMVLGGGALGG